MTKAARAIALSVVAAAAWATAAPILARSLIVRSEPGYADALVLLSGSAVRTERVRHALSIIQQRRAPLVLLTDDGTSGPWSRRAQTNPRPIDRAKETLLAGGVPESAIVELPGTVHSTYDEAVESAAYAKQHRLRTLLIVTSAYHSRRALWVFRRTLRAQNVEVGVDPAPPGEETPSPEMWWLTARGWKTAGAEYPKLAYYFVRHW